MRGVGVVVRDDHFIVVQDFEHDIDMIYAVVGNAAKDSRSHVAGLLLSDRDFFPAALKEFVHGFQSLERIGKIVDASGLQLA